MCYLLAKFGGNKKIWHSYFRRILSEFWTLNRSLITKQVDIHPTCTQESVRERCIQVYTWNVYSKRRLERVYLVQILIYCDLLFASITHKFATILLSSFDLAWFFKMKCRHKCVDTLLYATDTYSAGICFILLYTVYIYCTRMYCS